VRPSPNLAGCVVYASHRADALATRFTLNCAGLAHFQAAPGRAHRIRCACARRDVWRRLRGGSCVPRLLGACAAVPARLLEPPRSYSRPRAGSRIRARRALAPSRAAARRLRRACARCCRALQRRLGPHARSRIRARRALAPSRAVARRLRHACARCCRALQRRLSDWEQVDREIRDWEKTMDLNGA
jgi:hypothetical protein